MGTVIKVLPIVGVVVLLLLLLFLRYRRSIMLQVCLCVTCPKP
jgi:hypothetical protein